MVVIFISLFPYLITKQTARKTRRKTSSCIKYERRNYGIAVTGKPTM